MGRFPGELRTPRSAINPAGNGGNGPVSSATLHSCLRSIPQPLGRPNRGVTTLPLRPTAPALLSPSDSLPRRGERGALAGGGGGNFLAREEPNEGFSGFSPSCCSWCLRALPTGWQYLPGERRRSPAAARHGPARTGVCGGVCPEIGVFLLTFSFVRWLRGVGVATRWAGQDPAFSQGATRGLTELEMREVLVPGEAVAAAPGSEGHGGGAGGRGRSVPRPGGGVGSWEAAPGSRSMAEISPKVGVWLGPALAGRHQQVFWRWAAFFLQGLRF